MFKIMWKREFEEYKSFLCSVYLVQMLENILLLCLPGSDSDFMDQNARIGRISIPPRGEQSE